MMMMRHSSRISSKWCRFLSLLLLLTAPVVRLFWRQHGSSSCCCGWCLVLLRIRNQPSFIAI